MSKIANLNFNIFKLRILNAPCARELWKHCTASQAGLERSGLKRSGDERSDLERPGLERPRIGKVQDTKGPATKVRDIKRPDTKIYDNVQYKISDY
jgi:hypothetical protein